MAKHFKDEHLFEQLKQSPTELGLDDVSKMIEALPQGEMIDGTGDIARSFFNLKSTLLVLVPILIVGAVLILKPNKKKPEILIESKAPIVKEVQEAIVVAVEPLIKEEPIEPKDRIEISNSGPIKKPLLLKLSPLMPLHTWKGKTRAVDKLSMPFIKVIEKDTSTNSVVVKNPSFSSQGFFQTVDQNFKEPTFIPDLSNREMRKLKRVLYRNLLEDKLILHDIEYVEISLLRDGIIINDIVLDYDKYLKYSGLTRKVGSGQFRKIKMDPEFIQMGDFTEEGFKGSGLGTFSFTSAKKLGDNKTFGNKNVEDRIIKKELYDLDAFSKDIINKEDQKNAGIRLKGINLNMEACKDVHSQLYQQLMHDNLIPSQEALVLIELPPNEIKVNGRTLNIQLFKKYNDFLKSHKIRHGAKRQIRMSAKTISIGDFSPGEFTGTRTTF